MHEFDYSGSVSFENTLEIKDMGSCAIEGCDRRGLYFYLVIITVRGECTIATCGPVIPDVEELPTGYTCSLTRAKYDYGGLRMTIDKWLNSKKPNKTGPISDAKVVPIEYALNQFRDISDFFYNDEDLSIRIGSEILMKMVNNKNGDED